MTEDPNKRPEDQKPGPPVMMIPKSVFYIVGALLIGSFLMTLFVRNPYTQSVHEGGAFYENVTDYSLMMWVGFFIGIPVSFWAYKRWVLPLFEKK
jgi:hypothetical protein